MNLERWTRISDLYHGALGREPKERSAFLKQAVDGDESLRLEVESLLAFESASAGFLESPAVAVVALSGSVRTSNEMIGRQLGPYSITGVLGAGGMGEVYRAHDTKLGRDVAIKILPPHLQDDLERRARFAREARLLATLNHPHIGAIYGLDESDGVTALVLELVDGPTLAERLERGPVPVPAALAIARQIAGALEAAHEKGIVHRDLKPANIVLQGATELNFGDVRAKLLDFGVAKAMTAGPEATRTPRGLGSLDGTADGRIVGTPTYMSPEQAGGLPVDRRTDIWAFGCVLFEMLSGRRAFEGETNSDTFVGVLDHEPDWSLLPPATPESVRNLLRRCLERVPARRLRDIADARLELDDQQASRSLGAAAVSMRSRTLTRRAAVLATAGIGLLPVIGWFAMRFYLQPGPVYIGKAPESVSTAAPAQSKSRVTFVRGQAPGTASAATPPGATTLPAQPTLSDARIAPIAQASGTASTPAATPSGAKGLPAQPTLSDAQIGPIREPPGTTSTLAATPPGTTAVPAQPTTSDAQIEQFLKTARVVRTRWTGNGVADSPRATLTDGTLTHDAHVQTIDQAAGPGRYGTEMIFRDSWMFNVAAYRLDRLIGMNLVPVSVERRWRTAPAAFTWSVDDVMMDEGSRLEKKLVAARPADWNEQMQMIRIFDQLIYNMNRNLGNLLITEDWTIWALDHTRAFSRHKTLNTPENITSCDRQVFERMKQLDKATLTRQMGSYLTSWEIDAILARRDLIVARLEQAGPGALFDRGDGRGITAITAGADVR